MAQDTGTEVGLEPGENKGQSQGKGEDGEELGADFYMGRFSALLQATHTQLQSIFSLEFHLFESSLLRWSGHFKHTDLAIQRNGVGGRREGGTNSAIFQQ